MVFQTPAVRPRDWMRRANGRVRAVSTRPGRDSSGTSFLGVLRDVLVIDFDLGIPVVQHRITYTSTSS